MRSENRCAERLDINQPFTVEDLLIERIRYAPVKEFVKGANVLDIGCGGGYSSNMLMDWGANSVTGVDVSLESIALATKTYKREGLKFAHGFAERIAELVELGSFDLICMVEVIEHLIEPELTLRAISKHSKLTAVYITAPNDSWNYKYLDSRNPYHLREFEYDGFFQLCENYLGSAMTRGTGQAFLGFAAVPDQVEVNKVLNLTAEAIIPVGEYTATDASFFFGLWGRFAMKPSVIGQIKPMDIYTAIQDVANLNLNIFDINNYEIRNLGIKLQNLREMYTEANHKLAAISVLLNSSNIKEAADIANKHSQNLQSARVKILKRKLIEPPKIIRKLFRIFPKPMQQNLRNIRQRQLRKFL